MAKTHSFAVTGPNWKTQQWTDGQERPAMLRAHPIDKTDAGMALVLDWLRKTVREIAQCPNRNGPLPWRDTNVGCSIDQF
jgi:hypothetical protein